jgi:hypothetical protein
MTDGRDFLAWITYLLRFSDFAEGVFWRRFMNRGFDGFQHGIIKDAKGRKSSRIETVV